MLISHKREGLKQELPTSFDSASRRRNWKVKAYSTGIIGGYKLDESAGIITWTEAKKNMLKIIKFLSPFWIRRK